MQLLCTFIIIFFFESQLYCLADKSNQFYQQMEKTMHKKRDAKTEINAILITSPKKPHKKDCTEQTACNEQLMINIQMDPNFNIDKCEKYILLDEAYDPKRRIKSKILSPYLIQISRGEPITMYPLEFQKSVLIPAQNSESVDQRKAQQNLHDSIKLNEKNVIDSSDVENMVANNEQEFAKNDAQSYNSFEDFVRKSLKDMPSVEQTVTNKIKDPILNSNSRNVNHEPKIDEDCTNSADFHRRHIKFRYINNKHETSDLENYNKQQFLYNSFVREQRNRNTIKLLKRLLQLSQVPKSFNEQNFNRKTKFETKRRSRRSISANRNDFLETQNKIATMANVLRSGSVKTASLVHFLENLANNQNADEENFGKHIEVQKLKKSSEEVNNGIDYDYSESDAASYTTNGRSTSSKENDRFEPLESKAIPEELLSDPNLQLKDKLDFINSMQPIPLSRENSILLQRKADLSENKRSFLLYDDLSSKKLFDDDDYIIGKRDYDVQPCDSCGGKNKKPTPPKIPKLESYKGNEEECNKGNEILFPVVTDQCNCRTLNTACTCKKAKINRSSDNNWYSLFTMNSPLPYITMNMRIYRRRRGSWWMISPLITLNSLSTMYANENLSVLFSSHVDVFQLDKSLKLKDFHLLIPQHNDCHRRNPKLIKKQTKFNGIESIDLPKIYRNPNSILIGPATRNKVHSRYIKNMGKKQKLFVPFINEIQNSLVEIGSVPNLLKIVDLCPHASKSLCLNLREIKIPGLGIKIKMPFCENSLVEPNRHKIRIQRIVTDATNKDSLHVYVDLLNLGTRSHKYCVRVTRCSREISKGLSVAETTATKVLVPYVGETVKFLLPLILDTQHQHKKVSCYIEVHSVNKPEKRFTLSLKNITSNKDTAHEDKCVAVRKMLAKADNRCFCVSRCQCHCVPKLESHLMCDVCTEMSQKDLRNAGYLVDEDFDANLYGDFNFGDCRDKWHIFYDYLYKILICVSFIILIMFILGLFKAMFGLCWSKINRFGFDYVQPGRFYDNSTKCRRFFINVFFFIMCPFLCCCKCCMPIQQDLLIHKKEWKLYKLGFAKDESTNFLLQCTDQTDEDEDIILKKRTKKCKRVSGGIESSNATSSPQSLSKYSLNIPEELFDIGNDEDDEKNTEFILQALADSRQAMNSLLSHHSSRSLHSIHEEKELFYQEANEYVQSLIKAKIVYRIFDKVVGDVKGISDGMKYCVKGYFLPSLGTSYEFINYHPLIQYICYSEDGNYLMTLHPPLLLTSNEFTRNYTNKTELYEIGDLRNSLPADIPCINIAPTKTVPYSVKKLLKKSKGDKTHSNSSNLQENISSASSSVTSLHKTKSHSIKRIPRAGEESNRTNVNFENISEESGIENIVQLNSNSNPKPSNNNNEIILSDHGS